MIFNLIRALGAVLRSTFASLPLLPLVMLAPGIVGAQEPKTPTEAPEPLRPREPRPARQETEALSPSSSASSAPSPGPSAPSVTAPASTGAWSAGTAPPPSANRPSESLPPESEGAAEASEPALPKAPPAAAGTAPLPPLDGPGSDAKPASNTTAGALSEGARAAAGDVDEVRVSGVRVTQTSGSVHVLSDKQLKRMNVQDPNAVFTTVPGVYARGEDGIGLRPNLGMRGGNADRSKKLTLMEDGVLFGPAPYSAPAAYYFPILSRMRQLRVVKGPASIAYGPQTIGGAVELFTQDVPIGHKGHGDVGFGSYGFRKVQGTYASGDEQGGILVDGIHMGSSGFKELDGGGKTGFYRNEWMAKARYVLDPNARTENAFQIKLGYSDEASNETYLGLTDADFAQTPYRRYATSRLDRMEWHRTEVQVSHQVSFRPGLDLTTTAYRNDLRRKWRKLNRIGERDISAVLAEPTLLQNAPYYAVISGAGDTTGPDTTLYIGPNDRTYVSQGIQTTLHADVPTGPIRHKIDAGLRFHYDEIERRHWEDPFALRAGELVPLGGTTLVTAQNLGSTYAVAGYVSESATWGPLQVTPGLRIESVRSRFEDALARTDTSMTNTMLIPGVGLHGALTQNIGLLGGVHKGFSPPLPEAVGQGPEESVNYEVGSRYADKGLRAEVLGFYNSYANLTAVCTDSTGCQAFGRDVQTSAGRARVFGLEAYAEAEWKLGKDLSLPLRASYTLTRTEFLASFPSSDPQLGNVVEGDEMPYVPRHQASGSIGLEAPAWTMNVSSTYIGPMRERASQGPMEPGAATDPLATVDANASLRVWKSLRVYLDGRNLFDQRAIVARRPFGARPNGPRWLQTGIRFDF